MDHSICSGRRDQEIRLGVLVTCNSYRHPTVLAKMAATVDRISGGRLEFGIGAGWYKREHDAYGFPYPSLGKRAEMLRESLNLITRLWTEEKVTFQGNYYRTREAVCEPKPVQEPHPRSGWVENQNMYLVWRPTMPTPATSSPARLSTDGGWIFSNAIAVG